MAQFTKLTARAISLRINDVDTDQIIPARFLKATDKAGMGDHLFADWRYQADGTPKPDFALNKPEAQGAQILVAGDNFGCGSSREHAPWALTGFGFRDGLLPVVVDAETHDTLCSLVSRDTDTQLTIDLADQTLTLPDGRTISFPIDGFAKTCLLNGVDELGYLLGFEDKIAEYEAGAGS
jgi:3-isopropylmalate/(R)-2-methylmalate dehydratase small subunit